MKNQFGRERKEKDGRDRTIMTEEAKTKKGKKSRQKNK